MQDSSNPQENKEELTPEPVAVEPTEQETTPTTEPTTTPAPPMLEATSPTEPLPASTASTATLPPSPGLAPITPAKKRSLILPAIILAIVLSLIAVGAYVVLNKKQPAQKAATTTQQPTPAVELSPDEAFKAMLENNRNVRSYHIKVAHVSTSKSGHDPDFDVKYSYEADVDTSDIRGLKLKGSFDLTKPGKQAKGQTIWYNDDIYTKLTEANVTDYSDVSCYTPNTPTAKSPSLASLKAGFVRTDRSDFNINCGAAAYHDFIGVIRETNVPFSDFPHYNRANLSPDENKSLENMQASLYKLYDGQVVDFNGKKAYQYNVLDENYQVNDLSKILAKIAGYKEDANHVLSSGDSHAGFSSPGRHMKVWIDKDTRQLLRVESIVDTADSDIKFDTVIDYSGINTPISIQKP